MIEITWQHHFYSDDYQSWSFDVDSGTYYVGVYYDEGIWAEFWTKTDCEVLWCEKCDSIEEGKQKCIDRYSNSFNVINDMIFSKIIGG